MASLEVNRRHNMQFRHGVGLCISQHIWNLMAKDVAKRLGIAYPIPHGTKADVMDEIHHDKTDFSKFEKGGMNRGALFTAMTLLDWDGSDLRELPSKQARVVDGFRRVVYTLRGGRSPHPKSSDARMIPREIFVAVRTVVHHFVKEKIDPDKLTIQAWDDLHERFAGALIGGGEWLSKHYFEWHHDVVDAIEGVSYSWEEVTQ